MSTILSSLYDLAHHHCSFSVNKYYNQTFSSFQMDEHTHPEFEFMYVTKGSCTISYTLQDIHLKHKLKQGQWIFIDGGVSHLLTIHPSTPCKILNLEISLHATTSSSTALTSILKDSSLFLDFLKRHQSVILSNNDSDSTPIYDSLYNIHTYLHNYSKESLLVSLEISKLLLHLAHHVTTPQGYTPDLYYVKKATTYIDEYFDHSLFIADISNYVGISAAYLQRLFTKQLNQSIIEYITYKRIEKAILLLTQTTLPITDIGMDVGFNSRQHFTHTFKKIVGISPKQFRNQKEQLEIPFTHFHPSC